ncbi:MAG: D-alanine--D-alanine ligase [Deltaproteobacteria bacterium]|nr:D-alanine--D-alanine ligase [Deltaproteobacteria bacterium]
MDNPGTRSIIKVVVLHDQALEGAAPDLADNLHQAVGIAEALTRLGYRIERLAMDHRLSRTAQALQQLHPDVVFNLVESPRGLGRLVHAAPALLHRLGLPYTGSDARAIMFTSNKLLAKKKMHQAGLPIPLWITEAESATARPTAARYIIKSVWEHASIGLDESSIWVNGKAGGLDREMAGIRDLLKGDCFAEEYIDGREFNISLLAGDEGPEVLPPAEIVFDGFGPEQVRIVGYSAKWLPETFEYNHTNRRYDFPASDFGLLAELMQLSLTCWSLFQIRGWARVDYRVDAAGRPWILEVNTNPCLASDAGFVAAASRAGLDMDAVVARIMMDLN